MSTYTFSRIPGVKTLTPEECRSLPSVTLVQAFEGRGDPVPRTTATLCALDDGLLVFMESAETPPKAVCDTPGGKVHLDSCMEFFVTFDQPSGPAYLNFEINALGCLHVAFGSDRYTRERAEPEDCRRYFGITTMIHPEGWWLRYVIPYAYAKKYYTGFTGIETAKLAANFYKCGDETASPHWGCWNIPVVEKPDFHRPEFFGKLSL